MIIIKRLVLVFLSFLLVFSAMIQPKHHVKADFEEGYVQEVTIGDEVYTLTVLESDDTSAKINLTTDNNVDDTIDVDYIHQEFTVTDNINGEVEDYKASDFIIDDNVNIPIENESEDEIIDKLEEAGIYEDDLGDSEENDGSAPESFTSENTSNTAPQLLAASPGYITNLNTKLSVSGTINWKLSATYTRGGKKVYAYSSNHVEPKKVAPKKFSFSAGTAVSVVIGAIVSWASGGGLGVSILAALGATIIDTKLKYVWSPTLVVKRYNNLRAFYCGSGYTIVTKSYTDYIYNNDNGKNVKYRTGKNPTWYNGKETWKLADVAYQYYRWITGARKTAPSASEFYWT